MGHLGLRHKLLLKSVSLPILRHRLQLSFDFRESLFEVHFLKHSKLELHQRREARGDPRMQFAGVDVSDQPIDGIAHRRRAIQVG